MWGATGVGVGAIVGGGILALAGVALQTAGPSAIVAFAINGALAVATALSFAELATAFPASGGCYTFARRLLSIRNGFAVGWVVWSAYLVAAVLYALGFAFFALAGVEQLLGYSPGGRPLVLLVALLAVGGYTLRLSVRSGGGGQWETIGKLVVFAVLVIAGLVQLGAAPDGTTSRGLTPFWAGGVSGVLAAMGGTFIALQGFDLVAAVAGEVKSPRKVIPRAMLLSLGIALLVYLPLLFVVATVGNTGGDIVALATKHPETVIAEAARAYLGTTGFALVVVAGVLSMLSALNANLLAASRVAASMATDRTLPRVLASPRMAIYASSVAVAAFMLMIPDVASAGASASLVFLLVFALAHFEALLLRARGAGGSDVFRAPFFPWLPAGAGLACLALAVWQALLAPSAAAVVVVWMALGGLLYAAAFADRAELLDAWSEAHDPELQRIRGREPLVLAPIANPASAPAIVSVSHALAPRGFGRVLLLTVVHPETRDGPGALSDAHRVLDEGMGWSLRAGQSPEALLTIAPEPWPEIARVARSYNCEALVLGLSKLDAVIHDGALEQLLNEVHADVGILRAPLAWRLEDARRILVPVGGRGRHDELRARVLGSLLRTAEREVTFLRVLAAGADADAVRQAEYGLAKLADTMGSPKTELRIAEDVVGEVVAAASEADLVLLGLRREGRRRLFSEVSLRIAGSTSGATLMLSRGV